MCKIFRRRLTRHIDHHDRYSEHNLFSSCKRLIDQGQSWLTPTRFETIANGFGKYEYRVSCSAIETDAGQSLVALNARCRGHSILPAICQGVAITDNCRLGGVFQTECKKFRQRSFIVAARRLAGSDGDMTGS
jgi:hypothetical protein